MSYVPEMGSKLRTEFIFAVEMIISSKTGTPPPTNPVFPPCGTTASLWVRVCERRVRYDCGHSYQTSHAVKTLTRALHVVVAIFKDLGDLLCGGGLEDNLGLASVFLHPVVVERLEIFLVLRDS